MAKKHLHRPGIIQYRGKNDSVYVECVDCSHIECIAVWHNKPLKDWSKRGWDQLINTITIFLQYWDKQDVNPY